MMAGQAAGPERGSGAGPGSPPPEEARAPRLHLWNLYAFLKTVNSCLRGGGRADLRAGGARGLGVPASEEPGGAGGVQYSGLGRGLGGAVVGSRCRLGTRGGGRHCLVLVFATHVEDRGHSGHGLQGQTRGLLLAPCPGAFCPLPTRSSGTGREDGPWVPAQNSQRLSAGWARGWAVSPARAPAAPTCCCCCCFPGGGHRRALQGPPGFWSGEWAPPRGQAALCLHLSGASARPSTLLPS